MTCVCKQEGLDFRDSQGLGERSEGSLSRRRSIPLLLNYSPLDFMESMSEGDAFNGDALLLSGVLGPSSVLSMHYRWLALVRAMELDD